MSPVNIQTPAHRSMTGSSMTTPPHVLSPSSILPQLSSHCPVIAASNISVPFKNVIILVYLILKHSVILKLCN